MNLRQKVALVVAAVVLVLSGVALMEGEFEWAALGVFLSVSSVVMNFWVGPSKPLWRSRKD